MTKIKKAQKILAFIFQYLFLLSFIAGLSWAVFCLYPKVHRQEETVQVQKRSEVLQNFFRAVLPFFDNEPWKETIRQGDHIFYIARNNSALPKIYQITPSLLNIPDLKSKPKQTHIVGFAWVMPSENPAIQFLVGSDLEGNILSVDVSKPKSVNAEDLEKIRMNVMAQGKDLMSGHRDLLMLRLEPEEETVSHA